MHSEFQEVELDRLRYSLVWEGSDTLYRGLDIRPSDRLLVITSAGCNVLNCLLKKPAQLVAIDLNPVQNRLLELKKHIILHHEHAVFRALMGFDGPRAVAEACKSLSNTLAPEEKQEWVSFFEQNPEGIITAGKLEKYLNTFIHTLDSPLQEKLRTLLDFSCVKEQRKYFMQELHHSSFRDCFIEYFDRQNLSKGRDPRLFKYAGESGGESFYLRLLQQISSVPVKENFFFRFLFFGPLHLPERILPPAYRFEHYTLLREQLARLKIVTGEAVDYLLSKEGAIINKASLSNIFEYASEQEFNTAFHALYANPARRLKIIFWNLLQNQGEEAALAYPLNAVESDRLSQQEACFYFRNVRVMETVPALQQV